ncbi:hypothetical protein COV16_07010 [Candidatus Woesearchaeota archaeon CG10_big_fil_rev_8_21_14_0_10_34_8]|nr:MAG: hypothetical protein COV16_07010 [Candidatus Woesearchaeota archaeon CG10_big_fil_rev_8_21_14_0_10_34_8]
MGEDGVTTTLIRHGRTMYFNYIEIERRGDPNNYVNYKKQVPDIDQSPESLALLDREAEEYAASVPNGKRVAILSSGEMRAYQTAHTHMKALESRGIEIVDLSNRFNADDYPVGINVDRLDSLREQGGVITIDRRILPVDFASLRDTSDEHIPGRFRKRGYKTMWAQDMLEPPVGHRKSDGSLATSFEYLNESMIPEQDREDYLIARRIINQAYKDPEWIDAGFGDNWERFQHSEPFSRHVPTLGDNVSAMTWGLNAIAAGKYASSGDQDDVQYAVFTHEEMIIGFTRRFRKTRVSHCERLRLNIPYNKNRPMVGEFQGETKQMLHLYIANQLLTAGR